MTTPLNDSEIPDVILKGCKTPASMFVRVIVTGILCWIVYTMSWGMANSLLQRVGLSFPFIVTVAACAVVYIAASPTYNFVTDNLRNCSQYHRFKRLFRDEFGKKGVDRPMALREAEERLENERHMRHRQRSGINVRKNLGNGTSMSWSMGY